MIQAGASAAEIAAHLDALDDEPRVAELYGTGFSGQKKLWALASSNNPLTLESFVPKAEERTIYRGRNSLPAFQRFEKHFWRASDGGEAFGFNQNSALVSWFGGPGYFCFSVKDGVIVIDYARVPATQVPDWPSVEINEKGLGPRLVYAGMVDYVRRVSDRVVIGEAHKKGKPMGAYFAVTRVER